MAGEALIDRIVRPDGQVEDIPGGGPFNAARTIARLGGEVAFLGCLSTDGDGERSRAALTADGVDLRWAALTDLPTTVATAVLDDQGVATYRFDLEGAAAASLPVEVAKAAFGSGPSGVHVGTLGLVMEPIASTLVGAMSRLDPSSVVLLDPNCRPAAIPDRRAYLDRLDAVLERADIVKLSVDDVSYLEPGADPVEASRRLAQARDAAGGPGGPSLVLLTDGDRPVRALGHSAGASWERVLRVPRVQVIDTVGTGDAFGGAFLARWIERRLGRTDLADPGLVADALAVAVEVASLTACRAGADPPQRAEVRSLAG